MYLLDTNVVSELRKSRTRRADRNVVAWANSVAARRPVLVGNLDSGNRNRRVFS